MKIGSNFRALIIFELKVAWHDLFNVEKMSSRSNFNAGEKFLLFRSKVELENLVLVNIA